MTLLVPSVAEEMYFEWEKRHEVLVLGEVANELLVEERRLFEEMDQPESANLVSQKTLSWWSPKNLQFVVSREDDDDSQQRAKDDQDNERLPKYDIQYLNLFRTTVNLELRYSSADVRLCYELET